MPTTSASIFSLFHRMHSQAVHEQGYPRFLSIFDSRALLWVDWMCVGLVGVQSVAREHARREVMG